MISSWNTERATVEALVARDSKIRMQEVPLLPATYGNKVTRADIPRGANTRLAHGTGGGVNQYRLAFPKTGVPHEGQDRLRVRQREYRHVDGAHGVRDPRYLPCAAAGMWQVRWHLGSKDNVVTSATARNTEPGLDDFARAVEARRAPLRSRGGGGRGSAVPGRLPGRDGRRRRPRYG